MAQHNTHAADYPTVANALATLSPRLSEHPKNPTTIEIRRNERTPVARIRTIKPTFWGSRPVAVLSRDARLLALGLISKSDDDGRFLAATAAINGFVYPNDGLPNSKVRKWLDECIESTLIHEYGDHGIPYGCFPTWHEHQVINRYTPSTLPAPAIPCVARSEGKKK